MSEVKELIAALNERKQLRYTVPTEAVSNGVVYQMVEPWIIYGALKALASTGKGEGWGPDREAVARIIDPGAWPDRPRTTRGAVGRWVLYQQRSLEKADAILALPVSTSQGVGVDNSSLPAGSVVIPLSPTREQFDRIKGALDIADDEEASDTLSAVLTFFASAWLSAEAAPWQPECDYCAARFSTRWEREEHMRTAHTSPTVQQGAKGGAEQTAAHAPAPVALPMPEYRYQQDDSSSGQAVTAQPQDVGGER